MADGERYFLRVGSAPWVEVAEQQWRAQERACGFGPTAGFSSGTGITGRIYYSNETIPADVLPPEPEKTEYRWFTRIAAHEDQGYVYGEELMEAGAEIARTYGITQQELAARRAAYWRDRLGPDVKVDVLRQRVVTYPKEVVDG